MSCSQLRNRIFYKVLDIVVLGLTPFSMALTSECPSLPPIPEVSAVDLEFQNSWKGVAEPYSVVDLTGGHDYAPLGIGHLRLENSADNYYDWPKSIILPLWKVPRKKLYAWVHSGLVHPLEASPPYALTGAGMVETQYEHQTFIISEQTEDGWLELRFTPDKDGVVWTHKCFLRMGKAKLIYQSWREMILEHRDWLHFRANETHALRAKSSAGSQRITWIGLDHELSLLELKGGWMRVRVRQPAWTCVGPEKEFRGRIDEGWIKWRDRQNGPWVWFYARGC